jgi:entericidin B
LNDATTTGYRIEASRKNAGSTKDIPNGHEGDPAACDPTESHHTRRQIMTRKILTMLIMLGMVGTLSAISGCNTIAGAGTDIERGGQAVHEEAREVQKKM